jgi:hypothetical protein
MRNIHHERAQISHDDLSIVAEAIMLRFPSRAHESSRVERMRELLRTASDLARALSVQTQHALIDCHGTHGTGDLRADTDILYAALASYAAMIKEVAAEYRDYLSTPIDLLDAYQPPPVRVS